MPKDLADARAQIDARTVRGMMLNADMQVYSAEEASAMLAESGLAVAADYGLLCITPYWGDTERKNNLLACHFQLLANRP